MFDGVGIGSTDDEYEVKARFERDVVGADIGIGCTDKATAFAAVDCIGRVSEVCGARLDLYETDCIVAHGYDVDFHTGDTDILTPDGITLRQKMVTRHTLAPFPKFIV